ncbi:MAG: DUF222 domain-containing protein [Kineosporiaceae bacterium]
MEPEQTPHSDGDPAAGDSAASATPDGTVPDRLGPAASPVTTVLDAVSAQIVQLQTAPTLTLSDNELRTALITAHRLTNQVEAATLHLVRALDDRPEAMPACPAGKVAATFLVHALRVDPGTAARDVAAARRLDPDGAGVGIDTGGTDGTGLDAAAMGLPEVGAALAAGDISRRHVDHAVGCVGRIDGDVLAHIDPDGIAGIQRVDEFLAEQARKHAPHVFRRLCTQLEEALNPDKGFDPKAHQKRYLHLGTDATGMLVGRFALSPADGLIVRNVLHALSKPIKPTASTAGDDAEGGAGRCRVSCRCAIPGPRPNAGLMPWPTWPAWPYAATPPQMATPARSRTPTPLVPPTPAPDTGPQRTRAPPTAQHPTPRRPPPTPRDGRAPRNPRAASTSP